MGRSVQEELHSHIVSHSHIMSDSSHVIQPCFVLKFQACFGPMMSHVFHGSTEVPHQVLIEARFHVQPTSTSVLRQQGSAPPHLEEGLGTCGNHVGTMWGLSVFSWTSYMCFSVVLVCVFGGVDMFSGPFLASSSCFAGGENGSL